MPKKITIVGQNGPEKIKLKKNGVVLDNEKTAFFLQSPQDYKTLKDLSDQYDGEELFLRASNHYRRRKGLPMLRMGEFHFGNHNFLGPGTKLDAEGLSRKPFNQVDALAKQHDILPKSSATSRQLLMKLKKLPPGLNGYHVLREMLEREV